MKPGMKSSVITGASRGLGRAIAVELARDGYRALLHGRDMAALRESCRLADQRGGRAEPVTADLALPDGAGQLVEKARDFLQPDRPLHLLVNNAGIAVVKPFQDITPGEWQRCLAVNVTAPFVLMRGLVPRMPEGASIVNILSIAAVNAFPGWGAYCMSKFALEGFSRVVREEIRDRRIRVINVYPAATDTDIWKGVPGQGDGGPVGDQVGEKRVKNKNKMMTPGDVARAVRFALEQPPDVMVDNITLGHIAGPL